MGEQTQRDPNEMLPHAREKHLAKLKRQDEFLRIYAESCSKLKAANHVGVKVGTLTEWRRDPQFMIRMDAVRKYIGSRVEDVVIERALNGTTRGVYFEGERVGEEREYDTRREQTVLRALLPDEYGARLEIDIKSIPKANLIAELAKLEDEARVVDAEFTVEDSPSADDAPPPAPNVGDSAPPTGG